MNNRVFRYFDTLIMSYSLKIHLYALFDKIHHRYQTYSVLRIWANLPVLLVMPYVDYNVYSVYIYKWIKYMQIG